MGLWASQPCLGPWGEHGANLPKRCSQACAGWKVTGTTVGIPRAIHAFLFSEEMTGPMNESDLLLTFM